MLPLRPFSLARPKNRAELSACLADADSETKIMAGGTDLLPNLKHGLYDTKTLISLANVPDFSSISIDKEKVSLGAMVTLQRLCLNQDLAKIMPSLGHAAKHIASPQIRAMGTVGGNVCLDTRCSYFNQTEFWRRALGYCLKKDGTLCHVVKTGKRCVAASSNDLATMLLAHGAELRIISPIGERSMRIEDLYTNNGEKNNVLSSQDVVQRIDIPIKEQSFSGFAKLRHRQSFDFGLLSIGTFFGLNNNRLVYGRLVLNALVAKPKIFDLEAFTGAFYDGALVEKIALFAQNKCHPQENMAEDSAWRRDLILPFTKRAFINARPFGD